jgi:putative membrane protein
MFYLPRIFVNLALEKPGVSMERLLLMARKLYRFMMLLSLPAVLLGAWLLWLQYGGAGALKMPGWMHAKLVLVILALGYSHACGSLLKKFERGVNQRSHTWYRWFNEVPVLLLLAIVILVVVKPF